VTGNGRRFKPRILALSALAALSASCLAVLPAGPASASAAPSVINASLSSVSCTAASDCMAVGAVQEQRSGSFQFFPLAEHWNGTAWTVLPTPGPRHPGGGDLLSSVSCTSGTSCMAVGQIQVLPPSGIGIQHTFAESWNGAAWRVVPTPTMPPHTGAVLSGVSCTSTSDCMAVGNLGTPQNPTKFTLAEHWNGTAWTVVGTPRTAGGTGLGAVDCTSPSACMAAGFYKFNDGTGAQLTLAEQWNGTAWRRVATPTPGSSGFLGGVACTSAAACIAVGGHETPSVFLVNLSEQWNGTGWKVLTTPNPRGFGVSTMGGISCPAAAACMGVGSWTDPTGESSFNLAEAWNGTSWTILRTPDPGSTQNELFGISCTSPSSCMAVGDFQGIGNAMTLAESWNGTSWSVVKTPHP
jgi:hypothetical protein